MTQVSKYLDIHVGMSRSDFLDELIWQSSVSRCLTLLNGRKGLNLYL
jgi:hypothetical protein